MAENREVNFEETVPAPIEESEEPEKKLDEETDTQSESSSDENQDEAQDDSTAEPAKADEAEDDAEPEKIEGSNQNAATDDPKPVEGETPREKALRLEVQRVKKLNRDLRAGNLFGDEKSKSIESQLSAEEQDILKQYDPKEVDNFEKIIDVIAKKKGWVRADELKQSTYQEQGTDQLNGWLEGHPEYLPENDKDNVLWNRFQQEFSLYKLPNKSKDLKRIFDKVHSEVFGITPAADNKKINASKEKIKVASHGGATSGSPKVTKREIQNIDPSLSERLIGFSDDEKKEILEG